MVVVASRSGQGERMKGEREKWRELLPVTEQLGEMTGKQQGGLMEHEGGKAEGQVINWAGRQTGRHF